MSREEPGVSQAAYWEARYARGSAEWDLWQPAPALMSWLTRHPELRGKVLVPGCGRGYDAVALAVHGFEVTAVDFAPSALAAASELARRTGVAIRFIESDLFALNASFDSRFDFVCEHTCFCALAPSAREAYRDLVARVLKPGGELVGVFFTFEPTEAGPPFPIDAPALDALLAPHFERVSWTRVPDSVGDRQGLEHFGIFRRKAANSQ